MQSMTLRLPDNLMTWLEQQAKRAKRSKNKQIEFLLEELRQEDFNREVKEEIARRNNG